MTSQTKHYIELGDIIGLCLTCRTCGCSVQIETESDQGTINNLLAANNTVLAKCPTCGSSWTETSRNHTWDSEVKSLLRQMRDLRKIEASFGCAISLQVKHTSTCS
jgi:hypothetical protein